MARRLRRSRLTMSSRSWPASCGTGAESSEGDELEPAVMEVVVAKSSPGGGDEHRRLAGIAGVAVADLEVGVERVDGAGMWRHLAGLAELRIVDGEHCAVGVEVVTVQARRASPIRMPVTDNNPTMVSMTTARSGARSRPAACISAAMSPSVLMNGSALAVGVGRSWSAGSRGLGRSCGGGGRTCARPRVDGPSSSSGRSPAGRPS